METKYAIDPTKLVLLKVINDPSKRGAAGGNGIVHLCKYNEQVRDKLRVGEAAVTD